MYIKIFNYVFDRLLVNSWDLLEAPGMGVRIMDKVNNYDKMWSHVGSRADPSPSSLDCGR